MSQHRELLSGTHEVLGCGEVIWGVKMGFFFFFLEFPPQCHLAWDRVSPCQRGAPASVVAPGPGACGQAQDGDAEDFAASPSLPGITI